MTSGITAERETMIAPSLRERVRASNPDERQSTQQGKGDDLIASDKIEGTEIYRPTGVKIGQVDHLMIGKRTGKVTYVLMSFGGFLGIGRELRPVPWDALEYNPKLDGYILRADDDTLSSSPYLDEDVSPMWDDVFGRHIHNHWGLQY